MHAVHDWAAGLGCVLTYTPLYPEVNNITKEKDGWPLQCCLFSSLKGDKLL